MLKCLSIGWNHNRSALDLRHAAVQDKSCGINQIRTFFRDVPTDSGDENMKHDHAKAAQLCFLGHRGLYAKF